MMTQTIQQCPRCHGAIPREHYARERIYDKPTHEHRTDEFLYCAFCERGWEVSIYPGGEVFRLDFVARTEPLNFARFLKRLEAARAA